jgi:hypothetical protein
LNSERQKHNLQKHTDGILFFNFFYKKLWTDGLKDEWNKKIYLFWLAGVVAVLWYYFLFNKSKFNNKNLLSV